MQKFGLKKIVNEKKYHGLNEAPIDDREHNESWGLETSNIIGNENDDTAMYDNCDGKSVNKDVEDTNMLLGLTLLKITAHTNTKAVLFQNLALWVQHQIKNKREINEQEKSMWKLYIVIIML